LNYNARDVILTAVRRRGVGTLQDDYYLELLFFSRMKQPSALYLTITATVVLLRVSIQDGQKSKALANYQIVFHRIKSCQRDYVFCHIRVSKKHYISCWY